MSAAGSGAWLKPGYERRNSPASWSLGVGADLEQEAGAAGCPAYLLLFDRALASDDLGRGAGSLRYRGNDRFSADHPGPGHAGRALALSNSKHSNIRLLTMFRGA